MVCNLFIIDISGGCNLFIISLFQYFRRKTFGWFKSTQSLKILMDLFCHRSGKHSGIGSRVGHQLFLIQFLHNLQGLIRADFKQPGTFILKFCQIKKQWWILIFIFPFDFFHNCLKWLCLGKYTNQFFRIFFLFEPIFFVQLRRLIPGRSFHCPEFPFQCTSLTV